MSDSVLLKNPSGMVITWNYVDRVDASGASKPHATESRVILNTASLISISTNKTKGQPAGTFEIRLAPTFNWVTRITPGSWCAILMSPENDIPATSNRLPGFAEPETFKMLGRILSVRAVIDVNQETGARQTNYIVEGEDWGSVFNTRLYMDPIARNNNLATTPPAGEAARIGFENLIIDWIKSGQVMPTPGDWTQAIIQLWGDPLSAIGSFLKKTSPELILSSQAQFKLPLPVAMFMQITDPPSLNFANFIKLYQGTLKGPDRYSGDLKEAYGFPDPRSFFGMNTFWQLLVDNSNNALNELVTDIRFEGSKPVFALYRRIKPFTVRKSFEGRGEVSDLISQFKDIKTIDIPDTEVISINAGTNYRDKVNFVEIRPQPQLNQTNFEVAVKTESQTKDLDAIERDGFKPIFQTVTYIPYNGGNDPAPLDAVKWRHIIREWYFNTHNMLNGAVSFIGQRQYIQVGDNIRIPSRVFGAPFNRAQKALDETGQTTYLLAHVESISHNFTVSDLGARSFITSIQFSRGIIVDKNGNPLNISSGGALDDDAEKLINNDEKNIDNTFGTSTANDPDVQKLKGT